MMESHVTRTRHRINGEGNKLHEADRAAHEWYRFVLSFPPHLVRKYLEKFGIGNKHQVLDPFCGTGTTLVECKKLGIDSVGIEANPMACFASHVKVDWSPDPNGLRLHASQVAEVALKKLETEGLEDETLPLFRRVDVRECPSLRTLPPECWNLLLKNSISPRPLHKALVLLDCLKANFDVRNNGHELLALTKALVYPISNLHFGPEVGIG